ncbi:neutral amino acid transporter [Coelomomyces lativittatus]|nr:neutral amino acid transporter [Coelomomyces lativittatus]KAJ1515391.1 neutral amino acid transporter [Coelomomyces lativittatus]KAJ1515392.1 neutral amino acid transporter [Coelomomyces lativittatus]KAJ1518695.1 neutral amino acid transporter [Coelomomyces lativittatus]
MHDSEPSNKATASVSKTFLLLVKAYIGTGVLALPYGFAQGGYVFSFVFMILIATLAAFGMILLGYVYRKYPISFENIGKELYGNWCYQLIVWSVFLSQLGFATAYYIFVMRTGISLLKQFNVAPEWYYDLLIILAQVPIYIPVCFSRRIQKLASFSFIANLLIGFALCVISGYAIKAIMEAPSKGGLPELEIGFRLDGFALYYGIALYTFEGIGLVVPITQSMKNPEKFPTVCALSMVVTVLIYLFVASLGAFAYGLNDKQLVLENLPENKLVQAIHFLYMFAIMFSWTLIAYPSIEIAERAILPNARGRFSNADKWKKNALRTSLVLITAGLACAIRNYMDYLIALIGVFACVPLSFIYPAMLHYKVYAKGSLKWKLLDGGLFIFGIVSMIAAFVIMVKDFMNKAKGISTGSAH